MFSLATSKIQFSVFFYIPVNFWHSWTERREGNYTKRSRPVEQSETSHSSFEGWPHAWYEKLFVFK